jgi:hypothetical protein
MGVNIAIELISYPNTQIPCLDRECLLICPCSNLPANKIIIGLMSYSSGTNPIAGKVFAAMQSYGFAKVAVWPQLEGSYPFLSSNNIVPSQTNWYSLLAQFLAP